MCETALPSPLLARLTTVAEERALWRRLEQVRWPDGPTCGNAQHKSWVVRMAKPRTYPAHWRCEDCGLLFTALQNTPLAYANLSLRSWAAVAMVLLHYRRIVSGTLFAEVVAATPSYLRLAQGNIVRAARIWPRLVDLLTDEQGDGLRLAQVTMPAPPQDRRGIRVYARRRRAAPA